MRGASSEGDGMYVWRLELAVRPAVRGAKEVDRYRPRLLLVEALYGGSDLDRVLGWVEPGAVDGWAAVYVPLSEARPSIQYHDDAAPPSDNSHPRDNAFDALVRLMVLVQKRIPARDFDALSMGASAMLRALEAIVDAQMRGAPPRVP